MMAKVKKTKKRAWGNSPATPEEGIARLPEGKNELTVEEVAYAVGRHPITVLRDLHAGEVVAGKKRSSRAFVFLRRDVIPYIRRRFAVERLNAGDRKGDNDGGEKGSAGKARRRQGET